jgi:phospholipid-binding lipoprotein MlaA
MKKNFVLALVSLTTGLLTGCGAKNATTDSDPYEKINRKTYAFNKALDATIFRPAAKVYQAILPPQVHNSVRNTFNNMAMIPTVANDLLQFQLVRAYKDSWRFVINSTFGAAGLFDVATKWKLPFVANDFGITLAKWGDKNSPYFVMPIFGPSTFRDTVGLTYDYNVMSAYAYLKNRRDAYGLMSINGIQIRADLIGTDTLVNDALDEYTLVRDAYLQNRLYEINGESEHHDTDPGSLYIESLDDMKSQSLYVDEE